MDFSIAFGNILNAKFENYLSQRYKRVKNLLIKNKNIKIYNFGESTLLETYK